MSALNGDTLTLNVNFKVGGKEEKEERKEREENKQF